MTDIFGDIFGGLGDFDPFMLFGDRCSVCGATHTTLRPWPPGRQSGPKVCGPCALNKAVQFSDDMAAKRKTR